MGSTIHSLYIIIISLLLLIESPIQHIYADRLLLLKKTESVSFNYRLAVAQAHRNYYRRRQWQPLLLLRKQYPNVPANLPLSIKIKSDYSPEVIPSYPSYPLAVGDPIFNQLKDNSGSYFDLPYLENDLPISLDNGNQFSSFYKLFPKSDLIRILKLCKIFSSKNQLRYEYLTFDKNRKSRYITSLIQCNHVNIISNIISVNSSVLRKKSGQYSESNAAIELTGPIAGLNDQPTDPLTYTTYTAFFLMSILLTFTFILFLYNYCLLAYL